MRTPRSIATHASRLLVSVALVSLGLGAGCRQTMSSPVQAPETDPTAEWGELLGHVVTDDGLVDYTMLAGNRGALDRYVAWLATDRHVKKKITANQHAFWLNAYNALVIFQVLERGRPASVLEPRRILPKGGAAFFLETEFQIGPDRLSLSEIEHERIRQKHLDFRDHAAMNCASMSCPPLRDELYDQRRGEHFQAQLKDQMRVWVMDNERGVRIEGGVAHFNPIFDWFERDFTFWSAGLDLCSLAGKYALGSKKQRLMTMADEGCPHAFFEYDWTLNDSNNRTTR